MSFDTSPLMQITTQVKNEGEASGNWRWKFEFQITEGAPVFPTRDNGAITDREVEGYFSILSVNNIDIVRDYTSGRKYEHYNAIIAITPGVWVKFLLPNREFLRLHATRYRLERRDGDMDVEAVSETLVYKPLFRIDPSMNTENTPTKALSRRDIDQKGIIELDIDLIDPVIEQFRKLLVGGETWRDTKPSDVLRAYYSKHSAEVEVDGEFVMRGIKMEKTQQDIQRKHVQVPQGTKFLDVPDFLQNQAGGIWSAGLSAFLQDRRWYIWPSYNTENSEEQESGATIVIVPSKDYQSIERTFINKDNQLTILAASSQSAADIQQIRFLKEGDGVRFTSASNLVGQWADVADNKARLFRGRNNSELQLQDEGNKSHFAPLAAEKITDNNLAQLSRLASRRGLMINFEWQNADHNLLTPGKFFTVLTLVDDEVVQLHGRLIKAHASYQKIGNGPSQGDMTSTVAFTVFCNKTEQ